VAIRKKHGEQLFLNLLKLKQGEITLGLSQPPLLQERTKLHRCVKAGSIA
jgi:hypothetical protein